MKQKVSRFWFFAILGLFSWLLIVLSYVLSLRHISGILEGSFRFVVYSLIIVAITHIYKTFRKTFIRIAVDLGILVWLFCLFWFSFPDMNLEPIWFLIAILGCFFFGFTFLGAIYGAVVILENMIRRKMDFSLSFKSLSLWIIMVIFILAWIVAFFGFYNIYSYESQQIVRFISSFALGFVISSSVWLVYGFILYINAIYKSIKNPSTVSK